MLFGLISSSKLSRTVKLPGDCMACMQPLLELKTRHRFHRVI